MVVGKLFKVWYSFNKDRFWFHYTGLASVLLFLIFFKMLSYLVRFIVLSVNIPDYAFSNKILFMLILGFIVISCVCYFVFDFACGALTIHFKYIKKKRRGDF